MDTALPQKIHFFLDRNLAKASCTENRVCTSCDTVVLVMGPWLAYFVADLLSDLFKRILLWIQFYAVLATEYCIKKVQFLAISVLHLNFKNLLKMYIYFLIL